MASKKITAAFLKEKFGFEYVSKYKGIFTVYKSYFYRMGMTPEKLKTHVSMCLEKLGLSYEMLDCGDHYAAFRGKDTVKQGSHFWVSFKIIE